jgi:hypothetical protein
VNGVVTALASRPDVRFAVVWRGQLLPLRFGREGEAKDHLASLEADTVVTFARGGLVGQNERRGAA